MEKYRLVRRDVLPIPGEEEQKKPQEENEFRITSHGKMQSYLAASLPKLEKAEVRKMCFKATGKAINKMVSVVEVIKRKVPGLHQVTETGTLRNVEYYEPLEEGLKPVVNEKSISFLQITLSKDENLVNVKHVGYQYQTPHNTPGPGPVPVSQTTLLH